MKVVIVLALVAVIAVLAGAGMAMLRKGPPPDTQSPDRRMARTLALRVALSIAVFLFVLVGWALGWIQPSGLPVPR